MTTPTSLSPDLLEVGWRLLQQQGLQATPDADLAKALQITVPELTAHYPNRNAAVIALMQADLVRQRRDHDALYAEFPTAVDRLYGLLRYSISELMTTPGSFYGELREGFPEAWEMGMAHLSSYSYPQLQQLLNDGVRQGLLRSDINIQLVATILLEQVNLLLNPLVFPPERYNLAEVFRSIFLYYIRGICTDKGARHAADNFARL